MSGRNFLIGELNAITGRDVMVPVELLQSICTGTRRPLSLFLQIGMGKIAVAVEHPEEMQSAFVGASHDDIYTGAASDGILPELPFAAPFELHRRETSDFMSMQAAVHGISWQKRINFPRQITTIIRLSSSLQRRNNHL